MSNTVETIYRMSDGFAARYGILPNSVFLGEGQYEELLNYCGMSPITESTVPNSERKGKIGMFVGLEVTQVSINDYLRVGLVE